MTIRLPTAILLASLSMSGAALAQAYVVAPLIERSIVMGAAPAPPPPLPIPAVQGIDPGEISIRANANGSFELAPK